MTASPPCKPIDTPPERCTALPLEVPPAFAEQHRGAVAHVAASKHARGDAREVGSGTFWQHLKAKVTTRDSFDRYTRRRVATTTKASGSSPKQPRDADDNVTLPLPNSQSTPSLPFTMVAMG
jgi:hypothetical protein